MKKSLKRRDFMGRTALAVISVATLGACSNGEKSRQKSAASLPSAEDTFIDELSKNRQMPRDLVMKMLDQKVDHYMQLSHHCAQSSFLALKEQFGLNGDEVVKALTPMPGIAERGETCGAVTGPLMAMGLIYGRDLHHIDDWDAYQKSLIPTGRFCDGFQKEFGTTNCHEVQEAKFGKCYRLTDPNELQEFQNAGATDKCSEVVRSAVHMAAEIILNDPSLS
jgi:C_GCAxxG_C_C family probable redox protein